MQRNLEKIKKVKEKIGDLAEKKPLAASTGGDSNATVRETSCAEGQQGEYWANYEILNLPWSESMAERER
ncbi:uncharacterized protein KD926_003959 [Aspergillus affinis]|uniref:uncharacterized protein n=1 Tax=Aspergillus affinis TaxID=1070780 RepID=UPI0022FE5683|nr:uncharacterized protein KD926_003959 [Aspergillus affinis]KAI9046121.1 hypothetical protein KD926_003959 [Aspergillus affinis]